MFQFISKIKLLLSRIKSIEKNQKIIISSIEKNKINVAKLITSLNIANRINILNNISLAEFSVFSQWGDDGVIQFLINEINIENKYFIEFGVENYNESNTRFLLLNSNWSGLIIDSSPDYIAAIKKSEIYWKFSINAICEFITSENIDDLLKKNSLFSNPGIISIDIDGIDYWVWKSIVSLSPDIVIIEYNSLLGYDRSLTVPNDSRFERNKSHYSNVYFGASLSALYKLGLDKGYSLIYCTSNGNNAYFVKKSLLGMLRPKTPQEAYVKSTFRESRDIDGDLSYLSFSDSTELISGLSIYDIDLNKIVSI